MALFGKQKEIYQTAKPKSLPSKPCSYMATVSTLDVN